MAELWQAYGTWVLYGVLLLAMLWMHGGLGRRGRQGADHAHDPSDGHGHPQDPAAAAGSSAVPGQATGAATTTREDAAEVSRPAHPFRLSAEHETWMFMSGILALCGLVVVAAVLLPVFGPRVAAGASVAVVTAIVVLCYLVCIPRALARSSVRDVRGGSDRGQ